MFRSRDAVRAVCTVPYSTFLMMIRRLCLCSTSTLPRLVSSRSQVTKRSPPDLQLSPNRGSDAVDLACLPEATISMVLLTQSSVYRGYHRVGSSSCLRLNTRSGRGEDAHFRHSHARLTSGLSVAYVTSGQQTCIQTLTHHYKSIHSYPKRLSSRNNTTNTENYTNVHFSPFPILEHRTSPYVRIDRAIGVRIEGDECA